MSKVGISTIGGLVLRYLLPVLILAGAVLGARALIAGKQEAPRQKPGERAAVVRTILAVLTNHTVQVEAMGNVVPARRVEIRAQVGGRVVSRHPALEAGGRVSAGEILVEIEREDYEAALADARSTLAQAQLNEALERQRQTVAAEEWRQSGQISSDPAGKAFALREPYMEAAQRAVAAAQAAVERARRNLERTRILAPFDAVVLSAQVETGSVLAPQSPVAVLAGTDTFYVEAALPVSALAWLGDLNEGSFKTPLAAQVKLVSGNSERIVADGRALRLLGDMTATGLMARVLVAVDKPYAQTDGRLLLGSYVHCLIEGKFLENVLRIPRSVIREDETLWIAGENDRLEIMKPAVIWKGAEIVLLDNRDESMRRIISSALPSAIPGMLLNVISEGVQAP